MTTNITTLGNGIRVVTDRMDTVESCSLGAWIETGTRDENQANNGVSHVLEHMLFKGTKRRSAYQISEQIEAVGGQLNAYTSREHTAFYAKILKEDQDLALDMIADIIQHSTLAEDELEREQAVIIQEISQAYDTPDDIIFDYFQETTYKDQSMGWPVLGTEKLIRDMSRRTILDYKTRNYSAPRIVVSAAGKVDHDKFTRTVENHFDALPPHQELIRDPATYTGGDFRQTRDLEQAQILLGFEAISYHDPAFYAASVLMTLFGGGMSSRLFQEIRERRGLVYSIYSFISAFSDTGVAGIYAATGEEEATQLMPLICDEIIKLCNGLKDDEISRAKTQHKAGIIMSQESVSSRSEQLARHTMVFGRSIPIEETVEKVEAITRQQLLDVAARIFNGTPTFTTIGPATNFEDYEKMCARLK